MEDNKDIRDPNLPEDGEMTEEEKQELLSVFSERNQLDQQRKNRKGFKLTIRNQLILIGAVVAVAAILLTCYFVFLRKEETTDPLYELSEQTTTALDGLNDRVRILFDGFPKAEYSADLSEERHRIYAFAELYDKLSGKISAGIGETSGKQRVRVIGGEDGKTKEIPFLSGPITSSGRTRRKPTRTVSPCCRRFHSAIGTPFSRAFCGSKAPFR